MILAIHTVFLARENILFLEEWIDYHMALGFNCFYLYDNSKVKRSGGCHVKKHFKVGQVNKYNINYGEIVNLSNDEIQVALQDIIEKYQGAVKLIEWSPKDSKGVVLFNQSQASRDCLKRMKDDGVEWCLNIDMDEYLTIGWGKKRSIIEYLNGLPKNVSNIHLSQMRLLNRFIDLGKLSVEQTSGRKTWPKGHSSKNFYRVNKTTHLGVHNWSGSGQQLRPDIRIICFNHYNMKGDNLKQPASINNINTEIIKELNEKSKDYIIKKSEFANSRKNDE